MDNQLNLEDFIPSYPYLENNGEEITEPSLFNPYNDRYEYANYNKQEFYEDLLDVTEERPEQKGVPLKQQEFLARFLSPKTLNNEILLFHQVGTGKTCSAVNIAELAMSINPKLKRALVLVKGDTFVKNFVNELAFQCTPGEYIPDNYNKLTAKEKVIRLNKNIRNRYQVQTFYKFAQEITKYTDETIKKAYSDRVIIIDEVHNIKDMEKKKHESKVYVYQQLHRFLHLIDNKKVVLLSATPMKDNITEFASIMNLILPLNLQLPTKKDFNNVYFDKDDENGDKLKNIDKLKQYIRGRISFLRAMESQVSKMNIGNIVKPLKYTMIDVDYMSQHQNKYYLEALRKDGSNVSLDTLKNNNEDQLISTPDDVDYDEENEREVELESNIEREDEQTEKEDKKGLYDNSRQASLFVFPNGKYGRDGFNDPNNITYTSQRGDDLSKKGKSKIGKHPVFTSELKNILTQNGNLKSATDILNEIGKCSSKYQKALKEIVFNPKENCFVYSQFYKGSGLIVFAELLKLLGYKEAKGDEDYSKQGNEQVLRFAILAEKITNKFENNIKTFNKPENRHGKYIQVLLGSPLVSEGRSFFNVRQIHILTPHWNMSLTEQVTGRGIRAYSHKDLDDNEKYVKVYRHCSMADKTVQSIDYLMYEISEIKDMKIKQIERVCKEIAVDCGINKRRNLLSTDIDYTRECEYQKCNYICNNLPDTYIQERLQGLFKDKLIVDTYNLYYGEKLVKSTINLIQQLFKRNFKMYIQDLMRHFGDISFILLIRSLKYIIQNNIPIINKYGFVCYLRYERNIFFLVDSIQSPSSYFVNYYCDNPPVCFASKFKTILLDNQSDNMNDLIKYINTMDINTNQDFKYASELLLEMEPELQEQLIEYCVLNKMLEPEKKTNIREVCLKIFNPNIIELSDMFISVHLIDENKYRYLSKNAKTIEEWDYADDDVLDKLKLKETEVIEQQKNIEENPYGYYGSINSKQVFKIKKTIKTLIEEGADIYKKGTTEIDNRRIGSGAECMTIVPTQKLLDMIIRMSKQTDYFNVPSGTEFPTIDKMKDKLKDSRYYIQDVLDKLNQNEIEIAYYWFTTNDKKKDKRDKKDICKIIQTFFEKNNIIQYEK
jgi:superfamily II DNA or RNA helicase